MTLNFKTKWPWKPWKGLDNPETEFIRKITEGIKIHTLREDKKNRWKSGMKIHMCSGSRYKKNRCFDHTKTVKSIQQVRILAPTRGPRPYIIKIDRRILTHSETSLLAKNDGFDASCDFYRFFLPLSSTKNNYNRRKVLKLIHWTDLKY
jgi:hypothetical protein